MNSPAAQDLIRRVENILLNYNQGRGVGADDAMEAVLSAYEDSYGPVPPFNTNKDK